jgi:hypothetical protein
MVGLPTETLDDIRDIARLTKYLQHRVIKDTRGAKKFRQLTLSVASFVPKPWTPFQWAPLAEVKELKERQKLLRQELSGVKEVRVHTDLPKWAYTQALIARGDRRVGDMLLLAHEHGWPQALRHSPVNPDFFVYRQRDPDELFPWDFLDFGLKKEYLWEEYELALAENNHPPASRKCAGGVVCVGEMNKLRLGEGAKGRAPYPLPQTPTPNPLKREHRLPAGSTGPARAQTGKMPVLPIKRRIGVFARPGKMPGREIAGVKPLGAGFKPTLAKSSRPLPLHRHQGEAQFAFQGLDFGQLIPTHRRGFEVSPAGKGQKRRPQLTFQGIDGLEVLGPQFGGKTAQHTLSSFPEGGAPCRSYHNHLGTNVQPQMENPEGPVLGKIPEIREP